MKKAFAIFGFLPCFASAAINFPTGRFICSSSGPGPARETRTYDISKVTLGNGSLPYIEYTSDSVDSSGHARPTINVAGLGTVALGSGITTLRLDHLGLSFSPNGEPELAYCKRVAAPK